MSRSTQITILLGLCDLKGSYQPNTELIRQDNYPLAYPVTVVDLRDNSRPEMGVKFTELLKTKGQELLTRFGFATVRKLKEE